MATGRIRLRTILLWINLIILLLPVGSLYLLRIYENELIRQTQSELISQAAFIAAIYKDEVKATLDKAHVAPVKYGVPLKRTPLPGQPFHSIPARLDLTRDPVYPARPSGKKLDYGADSIARTAGSAIGNMLQDAQKVTMSGIKVLDYQGIVVGGQGETGQSFAHTEEFQGATQGNPVSLLRERLMPAQPTPINSISRGSKINVRNASSGWCG
jgi:hypothetical protein